jgi:hypothetical protein
VVTWNNRAVSIEPQRRGRRIAMTDEERDAFLDEQRTCRVGTVSAAGVPHVTPLWFVWHDRCIWLYSITRSSRWANLLRNPLVSVVVDTGHDFFDLRGVELIGRAQPVGEQPRAGEPCTELDEPERLFATKYTGGSGLSYDGRHAWLRITPDREFTWDFRKIAG